MVGTSSNHTMYLNVMPGLMTGFSALTAGFASINQQIQNITHTTQENFGLFDTLITTATVLLAQFTKGAIDAYAEYEQGMKIVQAVSNQTATAMDELKQKSNEFSIQYRTDIDQITEGLQTLGRAGLNSATEQAEVLQNGLQTAKLEGRELNSVLQELIQNTTLLGGDLKSDQFGEQSQYVNDLLVSTSMTAPITTHDISETLKYSGGIAAAAGANIESEEGKQILTDYMASIAAFAQKGVTGSIAGTALRAFFNKPATQDSSVVEGLSMVGLTPEDLWQDGGDKMKPVSEQIGLIKKQMDELNISTMDQLQIWSKIVGGKMGQQMMKLDSDDIKELTKDIKAADNASTLANQSMQTYQMNVKQAEEAGQAIYRNIGQHFVTILNPIMMVISKIMELLSNPIASFAIWFGIGRTLLYGIQKIWAVIKLMKAELGPFIDVLSGKIKMLENEQLVALQKQEQMLKQQYGDRIAIMNTQQSIDNIKAKALMAENEEIQNLQHEVNELKAQESVEAKLISLKKEKAALEEQAALAASGGAGVLTAQNRAALGSMYSTGQINQLEKMLAAKAATASPMAGFRLNSSLYKDLQAAMGDKEAKRLVKALQEGRLEITEDITSIDELMASLNEEEAETKKASTTTKENTAAKDKESISTKEASTFSEELTTVLERLAEILAALAPSAGESSAAVESEVINEEILSEKHREAASAANIYSTAMQKALIAYQGFGVFSVSPILPNLQWGSNFSSHYRNPLFMTGSTFLPFGGAMPNPMTSGVAANAVVAAKEDEAVLRRERYNEITAQRRVNEALNERAAQIEETILQSNIAAGASSNLYAAAVNSSANKSQLITNKGVLPGVTPGSAMASNAYQKALKEQQNNAQLLSKEEIKQRAIAKGNTYQEQRRRRILGNIAAEETSILQAKKSELEEAIRISEGEVEYFNSRQSMFALSEEQQIEMGEVLSAYQKQVQLLNEINAELQNRVVGETEENIATEQSVASKTEGNATQKEINAKNAIQSMLETIENNTLMANISTLVGGKFGGAMIGFMIIMEAWMHFFQDQQKKMQEATDRLNEATSNLSTALDDYRESLKDAYPNASNAELEQMELDAFTNMYNDMKEANKDAYKWIEKATDKAEDMPQYQYNDDGTVELIEQEISSEQETQNQLDKNTRALYRATAELNNAMDLYVREASDNWYGIQGGNEWWSDLQDPSAYANTTDWMTNPGTFQRTESQKADDYMGSKEDTGIIMTDFAKAQGNWQDAFKIALGQSANDFATLIPEESKNLLDGIASLTYGMGSANNLRLQLSMRDQKKDWQGLAKEIARYEAKNQKSVLQTEKTENKRLEGFVNKLITITGGGFTRSQILQMAYLQQMADMLSVTKEQIMPVVTEHMNIAGQNYFANAGTNEQVKGTGASTGGTYANAAIIAAYVAQMAAAKSFEVAFTQGMLMDPDDPNLTPQQKAIAKEAHSAGSYEKFMQNVTNNAMMSDNPLLGYFYDDTAMRGVAEIFASGTYQTIYHMDAGAAQQKAANVMDMYKDSNVFDIFHTIEQNYKNPEFIKLIQGAYLASNMGEVDEDDSGTGAGSGAGSGSGSDSGSDSGGTTKNRVDLVLCNKKEIPKLNVNLFKKEPSFTVLNKNFRVRDIKVNTQDKPKAILSSVKNAIIDVEKRTDPKIIQDEAGEYDPVAATEGNSTPTGKTNTQIDS